MKKYFYLALVIFLFLFVHFNKAVVSQPGLEESETDAVTDYARGRSKQKKKPQSFGATTTTITPTIIETPTSTPSCRNATRPDCDGGCPPDETCTDYGPIVGCTCCVPLNGPCESHYDCCSPNYCYNGICATPAPTPTPTPCKKIGESCTSSDECCKDPLKYGIISCDLGVCCSLLKCTNGSECCDYLGKTCTNGKCCKPANTSCTSRTQCCSDACQSGQCCKPNGQSCTLSAQCCSNNCSTAGTCI